MNAVANLIYGCMIREALAVFVCFPWRALLSFARAATLTLLLKLRMPNHVVHYWSCLTTFGIPTRQG